MWLRPHFNARTARVGGQRHIRFMAWSCGHPLLGGETAKILREERAARRQTVSPRGGPAITAVIRAQVGTFLTGKSEVISEAGPTSGHSSRNCTRTLQIRILTSADDFRGYMCHASSHCGPVGSFMSIFLHSINALAIASASLVFCFSPVRSKYLSP